MAIRHGKAYRVKNEIYENESQIGHLGNDYCGRAQKGKDILDVTRKITVSFGHSYCQGKSGSLSLYLITWSYSLT